ncbi:hypothetical protein Back11_33410 [Paenibacillus baekrokdamisoli]|uniref:Uncharacterized protein n=1 Tax=Paenibacillus baekrokdamisoli TaxID=1712516 RepID=A0A3G9IUC3_9BACL|nr:hypothetical protein [Paenibacillus baekrokdamisoli]MBB3072920.1 ABC-type multidrug transport system ATPase subunit [Paenibacillus baekrokdamisoli]BBH21996.1 hypothetical protein Back11_33410 [Paenibacillus baekrokdamisoli]
MEKMIFLGPSGSGKMTIKIFTAQLKPTSGEEGYEKNRTRNKQLIKY